MRSTRASPSPGQRRTCLDLAGLLYVDGAADVASRSHARAESCQPARAHGHIAIGTAGLARTCCPSRLSRSDPHRAGYSTSGLSRASPRVCNGAPVTGRAGIPTGGPRLEHMPASSVRTADWRRCMGVEPTLDQEAGRATVLKTARPTGTRPPPEARWYEARLLCSRLGALSAEPLEP